MNQEAARTLKDIVQRFGPTLWDEPQRCEALLKDLCPAYEKEVFALGCAIRQRVPASLLSSRGEPLEALLTKLTRRLVNQLPIAEDAARWAVESLAVAIGIASETDVEKIRRQRAAPPPSSPSPHPAPVPKIPVPKTPSPKTPATIPKKPAPVLPPVLPKPPAPVVVPAPAAPAKVPVPRRNRAKLVAALLIAVLAITLAVAAFHVPVSLALESRRIHSRLSNDESWGDLGDLYAAQGMYRSAQGCFAVARLLDPVDIEWQEKSKGWTEIVPVIRQLKVQDGAWVRGLGAKALTQEAPQTAFALLEQARLLDPGDPANAPGVRLREIRLSFQDPTAWVALGDAFAGLGDARFAAGSYAVARLAGGDGLEEKAPDLAAAVPVLHELGPYDTHWLVRLAEAAYSLGSSTAAKDLYALADSWAGGNPEWEDRQRALETIEQLGTGLGESSGKAVWTSLAEAYAALGDTAKAQACNGVALLLDPADAELRAQPYSLSGALALLRGLGIQNDEWVGNRGDAAASLGDTAEALELYRWALSLDTDDTEWPGRVNLFATIEDLRQRVLASYRNDELWGDFGDAYGAAGFSAQAAACYSVARLIQPMDSEWLAKALTLSSPVGLLRSFDIRDDEWIGDLGDSAGTLGNAQVAHELYAFALELDPDDSEWPAKAAEN